MRILLSLLVVFFAAHSRADMPGLDETGANCPDTQAVANGTVVSEFFTVADGCLLWITPLQKTDLVYREYYFDERGRFRIYESTQGPYDTASGSRAYFMFPRKGVPLYAVSADQSEVVATMSTGETIHFRTDTARIASFPGATYTEAPDVSLDNQGGVEIQSYPGILLDTGWKLGGVGYTDPTAQSTFRDGLGAECAVSNQEIFDYKDAIYDEPLFMFQTDPELDQFLATRCPKLDRKSLEAGAAN